MLYVLQSIREHKKRVGPCKKETHSCQRNFLVIFLHCKSTMFCLIFNLGSCAMAQCARVVAEIVCAFTLHSANVLLDSRS